MTQSFKEYIKTDSIRNTKEQDMKQFRKWKRSKNRSKNRMITIKRILGI